MGILCNSSDGEKNSAKAGVELAHKTVFVLFFTSDGHPMLLDRFFRSRRWAVWTVTILQKSRPFFCACHCIFRSYFVVRWSIFRNRNIRTTPHNNWILRSYLYCERQKHLQGLQMLLFFSFVPGGHMPFPIQFKNMHIKCSYLNWNTVNMHSIISL